jgi:hypothetical protein
MTEVAPHLYADSAYAKAVLALLRQVAESVPRGVTHPIRAYVAGGAAVHLYTGTRISHDLDVSKLSRFAEVDRRDIIALAARGLVNAESLRQRAEAALGL